MCRPRHRATSVVVTNVWGSTPGTFKQTQTNASQYINSGVAYSKVPYRRHIFSKVFSRDLRPPPCPFGHLHLGLFAALAQREGSGEPAERASEREREGEREREKERASDRGVIYIYIL